MSEAARAIGAGTVIRLNGKDYKTDPLGIRDFGLVINHLRSKKPDLIKSAAESIRGMDPQTAEIVMREAVKHTGQIHDISIDDAIRFVQETLEGLSLGLWISIDKHYPGEFATAEDVEECLKDLNQQQAEELTDSLQRASGHDSVGNSTGQLETQEGVSQPNYPVGEKLSGTSVSRSRPEVEGSTPTPSQT